MSVVLLIFGLVLFFSLVVVHEFGHFIMARRGGVEVQEFGIGFPPRLFKRRTKGGWLFTINLLPLGGFVKLKGEHDTDTEPGSLGAASVAAKAKIMAAGVAMNLLAAYVLLILLALVGMPQLVDGQFVVKSDAVYVQRARQYVAAGAVESGSPAAAAGIQPDDAIIALGRPGHMAALGTNADALPGLTRAYAGQTVAISYRPGGDSGPVVQRMVALRSITAVQQAEAKGHQEGYLGITVYRAQSGVNVVRSTWSAPLVAGGVMGQFTALTFQGLGKAITGLAGIVGGTVTGNVQARQAAQAEASAQVAGPVGIFFIFKYGSALGLRFILLIVAILSLTLAIMNILPVPALDGGRLWLMLFTRAIRRPLSARHEEAINTTGFVLLMGLIILITIADVRRFF